MRADKQEKRLVNYEIGSWKFTNTSSKTTYKTKVVESQDHTFLWQQRCLKDNYEIHTQWKKVVCSCPVLRHIYRGPKKRRCSTYRQDFILTSKQILLLGPWNEINSVLDVLRCIWLFGVWNQGKAEASQGQCLQHHLKARDDLYTWFQIKSFLSQCCLRQTVFLSPLSSSSHTASPLG